MHTSQEKCAALLRHHPRDREASQASHHWELDHAAQSCHSGLGTVSSVWGEQADLRESRPSDLYPAVAVGAAPTPTQIPPLDSGQIFPIRRRQQLGVLWLRFAYSGEAAGRAAV